MNGRIIILAFLLILVLTVPVSTAVANETVQQSNITNTEDNTDIINTGEQVNENLVCENLNSETPTQTPFGELINTVLYLIVTVGALVSVTFGAGFTMMSALKPTNDEYVERRNKAILFGGGTILVVYAVNAMLGELHSSLDFSCAIPFLGGI